MAIYRGAGGAGDAVNDSSSEASAASIAADAAIAAKIAAEAARNAAQTSETNADASELNAVNAATAAAASASSATLSANNSSNSAVSANNSATAAATSATSANISATNAATASTNSASSASSSAVSATAAANSAYSASSYATTANIAATSATASASVATAAESNTLTYKNAAQTSATSAASSASTANLAATEATAQAVIATTKANEADSSRINAAASASTATTQATTATQQAVIATTQAGIATTQASNASSSATAAATSASAAAASYDSFDDRYLGAKPNDPTVDNDGNTLLTGALYFNTGSNTMRVYTGSAWVASYVTLSGALVAANNLSDLTVPADARANIGLGNVTNESKATMFTSPTFTGTSHFTNGVQIDGDLTVSGTTVTMNTTNLAVEDNMIYLNEGSTVANPDLGFAGNYNDGTYRHAGVFRDASDGKWKFFKNYTPEPDASPYIDTNHASFALADVQANNFTGTLTGDVTGNVTGNVTGDVSGNAGTVTNGVYTSGSYSNPSWIVGLSETKVLPSQTGNTNKLLKTNGTSTSWFDISGTSPISYNNSTGVISISQASTSTNGYLSSTDWNTFNNKQPAGSYVVLNSSLGTPSSGTLTNCTGLPYSGLTGTVPTWNQNTTGTASNVTGTVAIANGGTGQTTASAALSALGGASVGKAIAITMVFGG